MSTFQPSRFCVDISIYDNETRQTVVSEGFNSDSRDVVANALRRAATKVLDLPDCDRPVRDMESETRA